MATLSKLDRGQLEALVSRLMDKTKETIMSGRDHKRIHAMTLRATVALVQSS